MSLNSDGTVDVDGPGAFMILATEDAIKSLIGQSKKAPPQKSQATLYVHLDDFVATALERNAAVLVYKSALQMLAAAQTNRTNYQSKADGLGFPLLNLDP